MGSFVVENDIFYTFLPEQGAYYVGSSNESLQIPEDRDVYYEDVAFHRATNSLVKDITIPEKIKGIPVIEIGCAAFSKLQSLETVQIEAKIVKINQFAFYSCTSLRSINIPSTVKVLGYCAISAVTDSFDTASGVLTVKFEPNSTIETIEKYGIERKEHIIIYYCGYTEPDIVENSLFYGAVTKIVFSPISLTWSNITTEPDPAVCSIIQESIYYRKQPKNTCANCLNRSYSFLICLTLFLIDTN